VPTARRNVKFLSSQTVAGQFTAESATPNEDHHEDTKLIKLIVLLRFSKHFLFLVYSDKCGRNVLV